MQEVNWLGNQENGAVLRTGPQPRAARGGWTSQVELLPPVVLINTPYVILVVYSFPLADHDFRYLLRKAVASFSRVWVVLHDTDNPRRWPEHVGALLPEARYRGFFGLGDDAFSCGGWEAFFHSVLRA